MVEKLNMKHVRPTWWMILGRLGHSWTSWEKNENGDFTIEHDGSNSYLKNVTGDLSIQNDANVKITASSGGVERFKVDL